IMMYDVMPASSIKISQLCKYGLIRRCGFYFNYHSLSDFILRFRDELANDLFSFFEELGLNEYNISTNTYKAVVYLENFQKIFQISFSKKTLAPYHILADAARQLVYKEWGITPKIKSSQPSNSSKSKSSLLPLSSPLPCPVLISVVKNTQDLAELEYHAFIFDATEIFSQWVIQQKCDHKKASVVATQITDLIIYHKREYYRKKRGA
ncbi:MAG: hypothetical protein Q4F60_03390, partial [Candidatus Saccharibacteria bacterium]|nr:hypothetical protein [Candidatus Saccharibacteria bacterium]